VWVCVGLALAGQALAVVGALLGQRRRRKRKE